MPHTPGPWKWTAGDAMGPSAEAGTSCVQNDAGDLVFYSCDGCSLGVGPEDAPLVIAAPELLEALKKLEADCTRGMESGDWGSWTIEEWPELATARAAISKAEGGTA